MGRKSMLLSLALLTLLVGGGGAAAYYLLTHEPAFYHDAALPPGAQRLADSRGFEVKAFDLFNDARYTPEWRQTFTEAEINSYFAEDFITTNMAQLLPPDVREPRVRLLKDELLLGFRYGPEEFNTLVTLRARVWLPPREPFAVVVEIFSLRLGAVPLAVKTIQDQVAERLRAQNIKVLWYRKDGHPVAVLRFQADRREASFLLQALEMRQGALHVAGRTPDPQWRAGGGPTNGPAAPAR